MLSSLKVFRPQSSTNLSSVSPPLQASLANHSVRPSNSQSQISLLEILPPIVTLVNPQESPPHLVMSPASTVHSWWDFDNKAIILVPSLGFHGADPKLTEVRWALAQAALNYAISPPQVLWMR